MNLYKTLKTLTDRFQTFRRASDKTDDPKKGSQMPNLNTKILGRFLVLLANGRKKVAQIPFLNFSIFKSDTKYKAEQEMAEVFGLPKPKRKINYPSFVLISLLIALTVCVSIWFFPADKNDKEEAYANQPRAVIELSKNPAANESKKTDQPAILEDDKRSKSVGRLIQRPKVMHSNGLLKQEAANQNIEKLTENKLHPHPDLELVENNALGPLPITSKDGRQSWQVYSRPFNQKDSRPRVAIVFVGLGVSAKATNTVIKKMPVSISLGYAPHAKSLKNWINISRAKGHEVLVDLPMEPFDYPRNDPGPYTLLTTLPEDQNQYRFYWVLSRFTGYVGVTVFMGSKFTTQPNKLRPIIREIRSRGLMLLDIRENPLSSALSIARKMETPSVARDYLIDDNLNKKSIRDRLKQLEQLATSRGYAVGIARPYPLSIEEVKRWTEKSSQNKLALIPISAILKMKN